MLNFLYKKSVSNVGMLSIFGFLALSTSLYASEGLLGGSGEGVFRQEELAQSSSSSSAFLNDSSDIKKPLLAFVKDEDKEEIITVGYNHIETLFEVSLPIKLIKKVFVDNKGGGLCCRTSPFFIYNYE